jgi:hypothetical protein
MHRISSVLLLFLYFPTSNKTLFLVIPSSNNMLKFAFFLAATATGSTTIAFQPAPFHKLSTRIEMTNKIQVISQPDETFLKQKGWVSAFGRVFLRPSWIDLKKL